MVLLRSVHWMILCGSQNVYMLLLLILDFQSNCIILVCSFSFLNVLCQNICQLLQRCWRRESASHSSLQNCPQRFDNIQVKWLNWRGQMSKFILVLQVLWLRVFFFLSRILALVSVNKVLAIAAVTWVLALWRFVWSVHFSVVVLYRLDKVLISVW